MEPEKQINILQRRIDVLEDLLVCYRIGRRASETLLKRLDKSEADMKLLTK